ncbi:hypothetical protein M9H77_18608 [Catharanthus roseus]|uniref:Uncharacterized protein n=1 Tax=Catharanthus roseus TaxID=4058 RepID=A0ACC0B865_CATRO|nr:hypothetical protein M9H77_18608 [Catharanthus roseus]
MVVIQELSSKKEEIKAHDIPTSQEVLCPSSSGSTLRVNKTVHAIGRGPSMGDYPRTVQSYDASEYMIITRTLTLVGMGFHMYLQTEMPLPRPSKQIQVINISEQQKTPICQSSHAYADFTIMPDLYSCMSNHEKKSSLSESLKHLKGGEKSKSPKPKKKGLITWVPIQQRRKGKAKKYSNSHDLGELSRSKSRKQYENKKFFSQDYLDPKSLTIRVQIVGELGGYGSNIGSGQVATRVALTSEILKLKEDELLN